MRQLDSRTSYTGCPSKIVRRGHYGSENPIGFGLSVLCLIRIRLQNNKILSFRFSRRFKRFFIQLGSLNVIKTIFLDCAHRETPCKIPISADEYN